MPEFCIKIFDFSDKKELCGFCNGPIIIQAAEPYVYCLGSVICAACAESRMPNLHRIYLRARNVIDKDKAQDILKNAYRRFGPTSAAIIEDIACSFGVDVGLASTSRFCEFCPTTPGSRCAICGNVEADVPCVVAHE